MYNFFAFLNRMKYINRWSLMRSVTKENIAEHSHQAALLAHCLASIANIYYGGSYDIDRVTTMALFHECSEVITGDLPTPIKYFNPQINSAYKHLERVANDKLVAMLPTQMRQQYDSLLNLDKSSKEYKLIKRADKLCAYLKCVEEIKAGNNEFSKARDVLYKDLKAFDSPEVEYFLLNFAKGFELTLDELDSDA